MRSLTRTVVRCCLLVILGAGLGKVADAGEPLRVGTSADYAPFSFREPDGALAGFDIAIARRLAADLGRSMTFEPFSWPELTTRLRAGNFDIAMSGVTVRADRALQLAFSRPYAITGAVVVIRASNRKRYVSLESLDDEKVRLGVNAGGHLERVARQRFPRAQIRAVENNRELPALLRRGEIDAAISETFEARAWADSHFVTYGPFTRDRKAYAVRGDDTSLLQQVNAWLAAREADGWLNRQRARWLGRAATMTPPQSCFEALASGLDLRLQLMPFVAAVKRRDHMAIEDAPQEVAVLERVRQEARAVGLDADAAARLFAVQIEAAKAVQASTAPLPNVADLSLAEVRTALGAGSRSVILLLAECRRWLSDVRQARLLESTLRSGITAPGVPPASIAETISALRAVR